MLKFMSIYTSIYIEKQIDCPVKDGLFFTVIIFL